MSHRDRVLTKIRTALRDVPAHEQPEEPPRTRGRASPGSAVELFIERVEEYRGAVKRIDAASIPSVVEELWSELTSERLLLAPGVDQAWVPDEVSAVTDEDFSPAELDSFGGVLTGCYLAIAETGTIVLDGGPVSGRRAISLVPDLHICVVRHDQIVASVPEAIDRLEERKREPLTFISGPSATSDIEFKRVEGVHGPRRLEVVLVT